jgi:hypothetical protein
MVCFGVAVGLASAACDPGYSCVPDSWEEDRGRYKLVLPTFGTELRTGKIGSYDLSLGEFLEDLVRNAFAGRQPFSDVALSLAGRACR